MFKDPSGLHEIVSPLNREIVGGPSENAGVKVEPIRLTTTIAIKGITSLLDPKISFLSPIVKVICPFVIIKSA